ncbi:MAG: TatD family hydrolase [Opitutaceae bacterium]|nr:TatD family hydrolase [Opitutaceae bacterium]
MNLHDAHNHLHDEWLQPHLDRIAADLTGAGIAGAVVNGTTPDDWPQVSALATRFSWVIPSYGVHPWDCGNRPDDWLGLLESRLASEPRAHVGEIGLDRWILDRAKPDDPRLTGLRRAPLDEQIDLFTAQLALAARDNRAASIHCIDAWGALFDTLRAASLPARGFLLHAYAGPEEMIKPFADLGAYFSFNGSYLDPKRAGQRETFRSVPPDRLLIETDAPAMPLPAALEKFSLPPSPTGTRLNHPANLAAVYTGLAAFLGRRPEQLTAQVEKNHHRLFVQE